MQSLNTFIKFWNISPLFPRISYSVPKSSFVYTFSKKRIYIHCLLFIVKLTIIVILNGCVLGLEHHLIRFYGASSILNHYVTICTFYWYKKEICQLFVAIKNLAEDFEKDHVVLGVERMRIVLGFLTIQSILLVFYLGNLGFFILEREYDVFTPFQILINCPGILFNVQANILRVYLSSMNGKFMKILLNTADDIKDRDSFRKFQKRFDTLDSFRCDFFKIFQWCLMAGTFHTFYHILVYVFSTLTSVGDANRPFARMRIFSLFSYSLSLLSFIWIDESNKKLRRKVLEVIQEIRMRLGKENLPYKSMELFLLNCKLNQLDVSVCGVFPFDWTLLYLMVAGISTYLVYLIQLREVELQGNYFILN